MGIDFDSKLTYGNDDKYIKIKIKKYEDSITTNVYNKKGSKKIPRKMFINNNFRFCSLCIWKYHLQIFLEECKYAQEKIKTKNYVNKELKSESDTDNDTDNDTDTDTDEQI